MSRWRDEEGVTLIELLVAMVILGIVMAGVTATVASSLDVTRESQAISAASALATGNIEEALATNFVDLEDEVDNPATPEAPEVGNRTYTVTRDVRWVASSDVTGVCIGTASGGDSDVLLVDVTVDWDGARNSDVVSQQTTVAPPVGLYDPNLGDIAIYVSGGEEPSQPIANAEVTATGPGGYTETIFTDAEGCAVFQRLDAGDYDVSVTKADHIDIDQRVAPDVTKTIGLAPGDRVPYEFRYDASESIDVVVSGREGGDLPEDALELNAVNTRNAWLVGTVEQPGLLGGLFGDRVDLWPDQYQFWAGSCDPADPEALDASDQPIWPDATRDPYTQTSPVAGSATAAVTIGSLELEWGTGWTAGETYEAYAVANGACDDGTSRLALGDVTAGTDTIFALPWGSWRIALEDGGSPLTQSNNGTLDPSVPGLVTVTVDRPVDVCAGQEPFVVDTGPEEVGNGSSFDVEIPSSAQAGDVLLVSAWMWNSVSNRPSGWDLIAEAGEVNSNYDVALYYRVADGSEDAVTINGSGRNFVAHATVLRNVDDLDDAVSTVERGGPRFNSDTVGDVDADFEDTMVVLVAGARRTAAPLLNGETVSPSLDFAARADGDNGSSFSIRVATYTGLTDPPASDDHEVTWNQSVDDAGLLLVSFDPTCTP